MDAKQLYIKALESLILKAQVIDAMYEVEPNTMHLKTAISSLKGQINLLNEIPAAKVRNVKSVYAARYQVYKKKRKK